MISVDAFREWALPESMTSPTARGFLAEYLVRCALDEVTQSAEDGHYVDIECTDNGPKIEVKCSAYLQPGKDHKLIPTNSPTFLISQKKSVWCNRTWKWKTSESPRRWADIYVFCLECTKEPKAYMPLDVLHWVFFVISKADIDRVFTHQKSVTAGRLYKEGFQHVAYDKLKATIDDVWTTLRS